VATGAEVAGLLTATAAAGTVAATVGTVAATVGTAAAAFGTGEVIGDGINWVSTKYTGESVSDHWDDWAMAKDTQVAQEADQLSNFTPGMSRAEMAQRNAQVAQLDAQAHAYVEKTKNPLNVLGMMIGIGR